MIKQPNHSSPQKPPVHEEGFFKQSKDPSDTTFAKRQRDIAIRITETSPAGIVVVNRQGQIQFANDMAEKVLGLTRDEITKLTYNAPQWHITDHQGNAFPDEQLPFRQVMATGQPVFGVQHALNWPDGRRVLLSINAAPLLDDAGQVDGMVATVDDVTDRVQAERALKEESLFRQAIIERAAEGICVCHETEAFPFVEFTVWNDQMTRMTGYTINEINERGWYQSLYPDPETQRQAMERMSRMRHGDDLRTEEWEITRADGEKRSLRISTTLLQTGDGQAHVLAVMSDDTVNKQLAAEMQKKQKLESIGILAGGIAHDFNNILSAIVGNIELVELNLEGDHWIRKYLDNAQAGCQRAKQLTKQLITFSTGGAPVKKPIALSTVIEEASAFAMSGANVNCDCDILEDLWFVEADETQLGQVLSNLLVNSLQAMEGGGNLRIRATNHTIDDSGTLPPGDYVKIAVRDEGSGIEEDHLPKIFDPYFSTKNKGSGLGLAVVYSVVKKHSGHIEVESVPGQGSCFTLYLPRYIGPLPQPIPKPGSLVPGHGRILVMDDEEMIRDVTTEMLHHLGYEATVAKDGSEAMELYRQYKTEGRPFDAVILDLTIPGGIGGLKTLGGMLTFDPQAKVIVSSGYSNDPVLSDYRAHGFIGAIPKPYRISILSDQLRRALSDK